MMTVASVTENISFYYSNGFIASKGFTARFQNNIHTYLSFDRNVNSDICKIFLFPLSSSPLFKKKVTF
jgi:hypothetical protein